GGWRLAVDGLLQHFDLVGLRVVAGDAAAEDRVVGPAEVVHHDEAVEVPGVHQFAILTRLEIEDEEYRVFARAGAVVGAGRDVGHAARLVRRDAVDAVVLDGNVVDLGLARFRIVDHRIAAGVVLALLGLVGVALLGAEVDLAAGADVVARVNLGLGAEPLGVATDLLHGVDDGGHLLRLGVELDEVGVGTVAVRADVEFAVVPLDDGEVTFAL